MATVYEDALEIISLEQGVLVLTWTAATAEMSQQDFFDGMLKFGDLARENGTAGVLVDVREFLFRPTDIPALKAFRSDQIIPRYNAAGVKRMGFLYNPGKTPASAMQDDAANYTSDNFDDLDAALSWCRG